MARSRIIAGKAVIIIEAQDLVNKTLGKLRSNLHRFSNEVGKIGEGLFRTGFFGALGSGAVINSFVKFDDAMRTLRVNLDLFGKSSREVEETLAPLEARIRSLAQTTPFNPTQVAQAATELAKGGFDPKQIEKALQAVLDLARATNTELGFSAEFVVRTLTTYGIATENAAEVVSQLVRASRKGTLGIEDLEAAMRYSSGTADTLGVSLQKMLAIFTVLSNRGLVGSIAGTSTNTAFSQLVKKAQELKDIGKIELVTGFRKDGREALDVISSLENLFKFAETLPFTEQQTLFQDVFNLRGARSVSAIRREIDNIKKLTGFIADANDEARVAAKIQDAGIGGSLRRLVSTIQDLGIALGQTVEKPVINIANTIKGLLVELGKLATLNPTLTSLVILSPGILLAAGAGMIVLAKGLRVAAYSAGLLKAGLAPLSRFFAKGTVGQITAASIALQQARGPAKAPVITRRATQAATTAVAATSARQANRLLLAQNQRNAVLAIQRRAKAEELLNKAEITRRRGLAKTQTAQTNIAKAITAQRAALDQNNRSIAANLELRRKNQQAVRLETAFQQSINRLRQKDFDIQNKIAAAGTRTLRDPKGGLREAPKATTAELRKATADRERIAFQIFKLKQEQTKLGALDPTKLELRQKGLLAERATILKRTTELEKTASVLAKGKTVIEARYLKQLTQGQDLLISSAKAQQAVQKITLTQRATGIGKTLSALGTSGGRGLVSFGRNILFAGKGLLTFLNTARRVVFSLPSVLTILEVLILFGDKIPGISTALSGLGQGFSNAFKAIGNIAKFAAGPIALFKASIEAFNADRSDLGIKGLGAAFTSLVGIIGNQLVAAWNRFKEAIAPVYDFVVGLFNVVDTTVRSIVESVSAVIGAAVATQSRLSESLTGFNFAQGGEGILSGIRTVAESIAKFIPSLFNWIAQFAVTFSEESQKFLVALEYTFNRLDPRQNQDTTETLRKTQLADIESGAKLARRKLELNLEQTLQNITRAFNASSAATSGRNANRSRNRSAQIAGNAQTFAQQILAELRKVTATPRPQVTTDPFNQSITPGRNPLANQSVQTMKLLADALVGSVQSTRGNLLRGGVSIEEKQLEEQKKTTEAVRALARDRGIRFAQ